MSGVSILTSVMTPTVGIKVSFTLFTFISSNLLHNFNDIHRNGASLEASSTAYAAKHTVSLGEIYELVHKSLTEALYLSHSGLTCRHLCEVGIHAGIPTSESLDTVTGIEILYVIALASGTNKGTGAASKTG